MSNTLGEYLRQLRGKESLRSVSERVNGGLSHSYISDLEKGVSRRGKPINPTPEALKVLAEAYDVSYDKLMAMAGYIDDKQPPSDAQKRELTIQQALDGVMSYDGEPLTDNDREVLRRIIEGYLDKK